MRNGAAAVNVLLNFWLIPGYGTLGALWATLASEASFGSFAVESFGVAGAQAFWDRICVYNCRLSN